MKPLKSNAAEFTILFQCLLTVIAQNIPIVLGYASGRHKRKGSIFIQELCKVFENRWTIDDVSRMANYVNRDMMNKYNFQAPEIVNQLGDLVFFQGNEWGHLLYYIS